MFRLDPDLPFVRATRDSVVSVLESLNQPQLSIPGKRPQAAHGCLCGVRNADGSFSVFASMLLPESAENVVYVHEPRELSAEAYPVAEADGRQFLESMGFILDDLHFSSLGAAQKDAALQRVPLFSRPAAAASPETQAARQTAVARLLASF